MFLFSRSDKCFLNSMSLSQCLCVSFSPIGPFSLIKPIDALKMSMVVVVVVVFFCLSENHPNSFFSFLSLSLFLFFSLVSP